ncbi:MAG: phosphatase PAP2 family protein [Rubellimicrobium sp.]|nr:phosphatase PAP2 family protein [Rubellimicrobium sp.]
MTARIETGTGARPALAFLPAERLLIALLAALAAATLLLVAALGRVVAWGGFLPGLLAAVGLIGLGGWARGARGAPRLGLCATGTGVFMAFSALAAIFIFALFPLSRGLVDAPLAAADAALGYDWAAFVEGLARHPTLGSALGWLYLSALGQIVGVIVTLGVLGRAGALHRMLLTGMLALVVAVAIWWLWPSLGPSTLAAPDPVAAARIGLVQDAGLAAYLVGLVQTGPARIAVEGVTGVIAFPSYHMVMALMVAWFAWRTPLFLPFALASALMVPATLAHGGHHLVDLLGGTMVFALALRAARRLIPGD